MIPPPLASADSFVHRLDARVKLLALSALLIAAATTPTGAFLPLMGYGAVLAVVARAARLRFHDLARRGGVAVPAAIAALVLPFVRDPAGPGDTLFRAGFIELTGTGLELGATVLAKIFLGVGCVLVLGATTPFPDVLAALERLRAPRALVMALGFLYRFLFVLVDEARRMARARDSRCYGGRWLWQAGVVGHMIGTLFLRSYERAERIHAAMLARGFGGGAPRPARAALAPADYAFLGLTVCATVLFRIPLV